MSSSSKDPIFILSICTWSGAVGVSSLWDNSLYFSSANSSALAVAISSARPVSAKIPLNIFLSDFSFYYAIPSSYPILNESEILLFSGTLYYFILYLP